MLRISLAKKSKQPRAAEALAEVQKCHRWWKNH